MVAQQTHGRRWHPANPAQSSGRRVSAVPRWATQDHGVESDSTSPKSAQKCINNLHSQDEGGPPPGTLTHVFAKTSPGCFYSTFRSQSLQKEKTTKGHKEEETCCGITGRRARLTVLQNEKSSKHTLARPGHVSRAARFMPSVTSPSESTAKGSQWLGKHRRVPPASAAAFQLPEPPNTRAPRFWVRKQAQTCPRSLERQRPDSSPHSLTPKSLPADGLAKAAPRTPPPPTCPFGDLRL